MATIKYTYGTLGADNIVVFEDDTSDYVYGDNGNDTISELSTQIPEAISDDFFYGNEGNDVLSSFSGNDVLRGGIGNDKVWLYGTDVRTAFGGDGWDILYIKPVYANGNEGGGNGGMNDAGKRHRLDHDPVGHDFQGFEKVVYLESWEHA